MAVDPHLREMSYQASTTPASWSLLMMTGELPGHQHALSQSRHLSGTKHGSSRDKHGLSRHHVPNGDEGSTERLLSLGASEIGQAWFGSCSSWGMSSSAGRKACNTMPATMPETDFAGVPSRALLPQFQNIHKKKEQGIYWQRGIYLSGPSRPQVHCGH